MGRIAEPFSGMHIRAVIKIDDTGQYHSTHGRWNPSKHPVMWIQGLFLLQLAIGSGAFGHARELCTALPMVQTLCQRRLARTHKLQGFFHIQVPPQKTEESVIWEGTGVEGKLNSLAHLADMADAGYEGYRVRLKRRRMSTRSSEASVLEKQSSLRDTPLCLADASIIIRVLVVCLSGRKTGNEEETIQELV